MGPAGTSLSLLGTRDTPRHDRYGRAVRGARAAILVVGAMCLLLGCSDGASDAAAGGEGVEPSLAQCQEAFAAYEAAYEADPAMDETTAQRKTVNSCTYEQWYDVAFDLQEAGSVLFTDALVSPGSTSEDLGQVDVDEILDVCCETDLEAPACQ